MSRDYRKEHAFGKLFSAAWVKLTVAAARERRGVLIGR
jgi:hypothetical protein